MANNIFSLIVILAGLAVATGAFGSHGLSKMVTADRLLVWDKAARYQMYHALALFIVSWALVQYPAAAETLLKAAWAFTAGIVLFSGSLYILVLKGTLKFGPINLAYITPLGGISFMLGWVFLLLAVKKF